MARIAVIGAGGWGTALAVMADRYDHAVTLWSPFPEEADAIRRHGEHQKLLPGVAVPPSIRLTTALADAAGAELVIMATPSFAIRSTARKLAPVLAPGTIVVNAGKGLEDADGIYKRFSEVLTEELPAQRIAVLSGPSHAEEVARGIPTTVVSAAAEPETADEVQELLMNPGFRIYANTDLVGVELGGALKNVIALAAGVADGLDMGDNTKAALMTRGLAEMARLGGAMGAKTDTFAGLAGMGDLIVTCGSMHSRNRRAGILIGQGKSPEEAVRIVGTVEGYFAARAAHSLAYSLGVEMPITEQCYRVCYEGQDPRLALKALMGRPRREEGEASWFGR